MLTRLEVLNSKSDVLALPLMDFSSGYLVKDIEGLSPVKATLTSTSTAQTDGAQLQSSRRDTRNITLTLGLKPNFTTLDVASLRSALYDWFITKAILTLNFYIDDVLTATTVASVESCDNSMFSQDPEMNVSLICFDPDFYAPADTTVTGNTTSGTTTQSISYDGTSDAGVIFAMTLNRSLSSFSLYNTTPDNTVQVLTINGSMLSGDVITVNTIPGQKSVTLTRSGLVSSILAFVDPTSDWTALQNGTNNFRAFASGAAIAWSMQYMSKYGAL